MSISLQGPVALRMAKEAINKGCEVSLSINKCCELDISVNNGCEMSV